MATMNKEELKQKLKEIIEWAERKMDVCDFDEVVTFSSGLEWRKYTVVIKITDDGFKCYTWHRNNNHDTNVTYRKTVRGVKNYIERFVWQGEPPDIEERIAALLQK